MFSPALIHDRDGSRVVVRRFHSQIKDEISATLDGGVDFQRWRHFCFVFSNFPELPYPGGNVNLTNKVYVDGVFTREGENEKYDSRKFLCQLFYTDEILKIHVQVAITSLCLSLKSIRSKVNSRSHKCIKFNYFISETRIVRKSSFVEIDRGARVIVGQKLDSTLAEHDADLSYAGRMSELMLWRGELLPEEIKSLSK